MKTKVEELIDGLEETKDAFVEGSGEWKSLVDAVEFLQSLLIGKEGGTMRLNPVTFRGTKERNRGEKIALTMGRLWIDKGDGKWEKPVSNDWGLGAYPKAGIHAPQSTRTIDG